MRDGIKSLIMDTYEGVLGTKEREVEMDTNTMTVDMVKDLATSAMRISMQASIDNNGWYKRFKDLSDECSRLQGSIVQKEIELVRKEFQITKQAVVIKELNEKLQKYVADA